MGMYDYVEIGSSVPLREFEGHRDQIEWQTKTFSCDMRTYRITSDAELIEEQFHTEPVPEEDRPLYNEEIGGFESEWEKLAGSIRHVTDGWEPKRYHGRVEVTGMDDDYFYRYSFIFSHGKLEDVELVEKAERADVGIVAPDTHSGRPSSDREPRGSTGEDGSPGL